ncbi:MAG: hypothetical protein KDA41_00855, partial [Planctomycetales bacterium]|nr:hypothetical protein [Planctomycetales bacterium]
NAPVEFTNPRNGHRYRLFQENFDGPYEPGSNEYTALVPPTATPDDLYASVLTVNYDPGRWIRNIGCLLIVAGISTMFYMRAYFFKPRRRSEDRSASPQRAADASRVEQANSPSPERTPEGAAT